MVIIIDLSFLVDFCLKLNNLNLELQGKNKSLIDMISAKRSFEQFLILLKENLNRRELRHFPYLLKFLKKNPEMSKCDFKKFINVVEREIHERFGEFNNIVRISSFIKQSVSTKF